MEINELAEKQIGELKPLEIVSAKDLGVGQGWSVLRVPGGWIFIFLDSSCFVPDPKPVTAPGDAPKQPIRKRTRKSKKQERKEP
jgi:hypothetical protein